MNTALLSLYLAIFWFCLGITLLLLDLFGGYSPYRLPLGPNGLSMGWPALFLAAYNLMRWWMARPRQRPPNRLEELRRRRRPRDPNETPAEPDPNFVFTDVPPPPRTNPPERPG